MDSRSHSKSRSSHDKSPTLTTELVLVGVLAAILVTGLALIIVGFN